ncbi:DUF2971 domain-containing protein [Nocardia sp. NPDC127526]|uniref:DUF2971 domain-containing protein n=1 Tax=Nocardia sp. NPDC127526 TaxID=3345393 RepID=UPI00364283BA
MLEFGGRNVEWDGPVWKYFRMERFIETLEMSTLYFAAATQFSDPFEGAVAVQADEHDTDPRYAAMEISENAFFALKRLTKISCWHRASYESDAMWKLYANEHKGIAICTTPERMRAAFRPFRLSPDYGVEQLIAAPVEYIDLTQVRMNGAGMLDRFFFKHRAFEWEREFRLAISLRMAEEFGVQVPDGGIHVEFDLEALVDRIVLGSTISAHEREIVAASVEGAGLGDRLQYSTLLGRPRYI